MRMLMNVDFPHEPFNELVKEGKASEVLQSILADIKPEAAYFTEFDGSRSAVLVIDVADASQIPSYAEPFFLQFNAQCQFRIAMTPEDVGKAGLDELGNKWR